MKTKQNRLTEVYNYLHDNCNVHNQTDFANKIGYSRVMVSAAINGNERYLSDALFRKICQVYPIINEQYLLTGEGELLVPEEKTAHEDPLREEREPSVVNQAANIIDLYAGLIKEIEVLRFELNQELANVRAEREDAHRLVTTLHDCLFELRTILAQQKGHITRPSFAADDGPSDCLADPATDPDS